MGVLTTNRERISAFLGELKRRDVIKVAVVYVVVGLGVAQAADVFLGNLAPQWILNAALVVLLLGFPVALVLAWVYSITPAGLMRDEKEKRARASGSYTPSSGASPRVWSPSVFDRRSIAVLPFVNHSDDPENEYFADGITDDILTSLTFIEGLRVISRTSAMHYKGTTKKTRTIAEELGVEVVLEGSVRRADGRVRVVAQLIDARNDEHLWAATYDRDLKDVFAVQSDVAKNVARALQSPLTARGTARLELRGATQNIRAYELVARARHAYLKVTREHVDHAKKLLKQALQLDPEYAQAWAHLALAEFVLPYFSAVSPASLEASAKKAIDRALELDDGLPEAYVARAHWRFQFRFDWDGAEEDFARALELNPSSADAYQWRGLMHLLCERASAAIHEGRQSVVLDPLSFQTRSQLAQNLIWSGQPELAKPIVEELVEEDPTNLIAHWSLGIIARANDPAAALVHFDRALSFRYSPLAQASRALALRALGRNAEADEAVDELTARAGTGPEYVSPFVLAVAYFGKQDGDRAFRYLEEGVNNHDFLSLYLRIGLGERVKNDPRYRELARRIWPKDFPAATVEAGANVARPSGAAN
jgi:TolB-like protein/Tfp pilus assembly protein PilF